MQLVWFVDARKAHKSNENKTNYNDVDSPAHQVADEKRPPNCQLSFVIFVRRREAVGVGCWKLVTAVLMMNDAQMGDCDVITHFLIDDQLCH